MRSSIDSSWWYTGISAPLSTLPLEVILANSDSALSSRLITWSAVDSLDSAADIWPEMLESSPSSCPALCAAAMPAGKVNAKNAVSITIRRCEKSGRFICLIPNAVPREMIFLDKDNAPITSSEFQYSRNFRDAGKRTNSGGAARNRRRRLPVLAIDQHGSHPERRGRREIQVLRVADMHRVVPDDAGAGEGSVVQLAPRLSIAGFGGNRDRVEVTGQVEAVENSIQAIVEVGDHAQFKSIVL